MTTAFSSLRDIHAILADLPGADAEARAGAEARNAQLTKPAGALGRLEEIAIWYAAWRGDARPKVSAPQIVIFAGNHGVAARGVSAFPPEVTHQMVANFQAGGAAINQLAQFAGARMDVVPLLLNEPTDDFTKGPAMSEDAFLTAFAAGWNSVDRRADLFVAGEMGIGNTTSAAAILTALLGGDAADWTGRGTGVDDDGLRIKTDTVRAGLARNPDRDPLQVLRCLGGREIAAMAGAILSARANRIPVILDGFICASAAVALFSANSAALDHCVAGHVSDETAHARVLQAIGKEPLLDLNMRLGEGSGGATAISIVGAAVACHSGMATFAEAGVSDA